MTAVPKIMVIAGSTRQGAFSGKLAAASEQELRKLACEPTLVSLKDFPMPIYDGDLEAGSGFPDGARQFAASFAGFHGILMVTPEYNQSLPPLLKNAIDWLSRMRGEVQASLRGKTFALLSSSIGHYGGARALMDLRRVLGSAFNGLVIPEQMSLPNGGSAFAPTGELAQEAQQQQLRAVCVALVKMTNLVSVPHGDT